MDNEEDFVVTHAAPNTKASGWDRVGGMFWTLGRVSARPSRKEIDLFLDRIDAGAACVVIGASTKELIEEALARGIAVTVLDFSRGMCDALRRELGETIAGILHCDILDPVPPMLRGGSDYVLSDRLLNRFTLEEAARGVYNMLDLLKIGGELRTSVKLGLYDMDRRMIEAGRRDGTLHEFFDEATGTIDFARAGKVLAENILPHGDIPREVLLEWYLARGREKRFERDEIVDVIDGVTMEDRAFGRVDVEPFPDAPATMMYTATVVSRK